MHSLSRFSWEGATAYLFLDQPYGPRPAGAPTVYGLGDAVRSTCISSFDLAPDCPRPRTSSSHQTAVAYSTHGSPSQTAREACGNERNRRPELMGFRRGDGWVRRAPSSRRRHIYIYIYSKRRYSRSTAGRLEERTCLAFYHAEDCSPKTYHPGVGRFHESSSAEPLRSESALDAGSKVSPDVGTVSQGTKSPETDVRGGNIIVYYQRLYLLF